MTREDLEALIRLGEDSLLELKHVVVRASRVEAPDGKSIADELSAFANSHFGRIVFGVDDRTLRLEPMSVADLNLVETWVRNICNDLIEPQLACKILKVPVSDRGGVLVVEVPRSVFVHKGGHGYFTRIGSSKRELTPESLARLFQQKGQSRIVCFDEQVIASAGIDNLDPKLYNRYRTSLSDADDSAFLKKLHFIAGDDQGQLKPTVSGILMASPHPEAYLPSAYIQAVAYRGTRKTAADQLDARDITGPLDLQISEALRFVSRNMRVYAVKAPGRIDIPQFSLTSVFEAVVNAVAHRDYSIRGAKIRLHMFADRMEIYSPGGLPNSLEIDEMSERQFARNELICSVLSRCKLTEGVQGVSRLTIMDRRGEGVPIIFEEGKKYADKKPKYELVGEDELLLTLYSAPGDSPADLYRIAQNYTDNYTDKPTQVLAILKREPGATQAQLVKACDVSRSTIANILARLKREGRIVREGSDRAGIWKVL